MAWYGTLIAIVPHSTFDHLLQGFRIHVALPGLSQALCKGRGNEMARCTETPALGVLLDLDPARIEKVSPG